MTITSGSSEFNLVTLHPDDFSLVEQIHDQDHVNIDSFAMKELIDLTNYAAATDEDRPVFTGALLEIKENEVTMVATDTHRMAVKKITIDEPATTMNQQRLQCVLSFLQKRWLKYLVYYQQIIQL